MKKELRIVTILIFLFFLISCASKTLWKSEPSYDKISNQFFNATITPIYGFDGYKGFLLAIHNKASEEIIFDWRNTFYLQSGKKIGRFWFEGIQQDVQQKNDPIVIPAGEISTIELYPDELRVLSALAGSHVNKNMPSGENGIYLTVNVPGEIISETQTFFFSQ